MISYKKLWKLLYDKNFNKTYLREKGIHPTSIAKMGRNEFVDTRVLHRICEILNCDFSNIIEYIPDNKEEKTD